MSQHPTIIGFATAIFLAALTGCDAYGPFEPTDVSYYEYETFDPRLRGDCDWLIDALGCDGSDCTVVGTEGEMEIGLNDEGDAIRVDMRGEESPEWITLYGPTFGDEFAAEYSLEETEQGVTAAVFVEISGDDTDGEINGDVVVVLDIVGFGESYSCTVEVEYTAVPAGEAEFAMTAEGGRTRPVRDHEMPVLSLLRAR